MFSIAVNQESITNIADGLKHAHLYEIKSNCNKWLIDLVLFHTIFIQYKYVSKE